MNKTEFIEAVAAKSKQTKTAAGDAIDAALAVITEALAKGDTVAFTGFGSFLVRKREARTGRNPATGATIKIAAANAPGFKAGAKLKAAVNAPKGKKKAK